MFIAKKNWNHISFTFFFFFFFLFTFYSSEMVTCPLNSEHYVPADKLQKHVTSCSWRMEGYSEQDIPLPESCVSDESGITIGIS
jgi:hypothetical protein